MTRLVILLALALCGCAAGVTPRQGPLTSLRLPQAAEQCAAQPELAWCDARR